MQRPMSEVLYVIYCRSELCSSILQANDQCLQYSDITKLEHATADRMLGKWIATLKDDLADSFSARRIAFKHFINECKNNELYCIR